VLVAGEVAVMLGKHLALLDARERRRLLALLAAGARRRGALRASERVELMALVAKLEPRLLFGSAARRLSPVPLPRRLLYGRRKRRRELESG
jgi:hypothetical protein